WGEYFRRTVVSVTELGHRTKETFDRTIREERARAFRAATDNRALLDDLLSGSIEISGLLDRLYRSHAPGRSLIVSRACGGCPDHRLRGQADTAYAEPPAYGIEQILPADTSLWQARFPHLDATAPAILSLVEPFDDALVLGILKDLVSLFGIKEVGVTTRFRSANRGLARLHRQAEGGILLVQNLEEEEHRPSAYELPRATVWNPNGGRGIPPYLFNIGRPLHVIVAPVSTPDPWHAERRLSDTGSNLLSYDQFKAGTQI
ncbi:MAG: hypothetical protein ACP5RC_07510, partial [Halothiobacillaceae bacterium]